MRKCKEKENIYLDKVLKHDNSTVFTLLPLSENENTGLTFGAFISFNNLHHILLSIHLR